MRIPDLVLLSQNAESFFTLLPLTDIKTGADKTEAQKNGYRVGYTVAELQEEFPDIDPACIFFANAFPPAFYWNKDTMVVFPLHLYERQLMAPGNDQNLSDHIKRGIAQISAKIQANNYSFILTSLNDRMRMEYLKMLLERSVPGLYDLFLDIYHSCDFGCAAIGRDGIDKLLALKSDKEWQHTRRALAHLPEVVTVYRGVGDKSSHLDEAYSWTLSPNIALFFATRLSKESASVYTAQVKREDIFEYIDATDECECLVLPEKVFNVQEDELYGHDWLNEAMEDVAQLYLDCKRRAMYDKIPFETSSEIHEKSHSLRVLFHSLLLANLYQLDETDKLVLAEAALYHDTGRIDDTADRKHGTRSAKKYKHAVKNADPLVVFLMKYHCKPDEEGLAFIDANPELSKDRERAITLFNIFKDADGLDRVRLGPKEIDPCQLRTEEAKKLPLIAEMTLNNLEA